MIGSTATSIAEQMAHDQRSIAWASAATPRRPAAQVQREIEQHRCAPNTARALSSFSTSISPIAGRPIIDTSGDTGRPSLPPMVSSSATSSEPSCSVTTLRPEEQFGGAQHERVVAAVERVAQDRDAPAD